MKPSLLTAVLVFMLSVTQAQENSKVISENVTGGENNLEATRKKDLKKNLFTLYSKKEKPVIVVTSHREQDVTIYVFDAEGTLVYQGILRHHEKLKVEVATKGTYSYTIFDRNESVEEGKLIIK
ncbi:MAG TPA: T9SS type A sorting domain-containing protein [Flavisolibacter sp.]